MLQLPGRGQGERWGAQFMLEGLVDKVKSKTGKADVCVGREGRSPT